MRLFVFRKYLRGRWGGAHSTCRLAALLSNLPQRAQAAHTEGNFMLQRRMEMKSRVIISFVTSRSIMCERGSPSGVDAPVLVGGPWLARAPGPSRAVGSVHGHPVSSGHMSLRQMTNVVSSPEQRQSGGGRHARLPGPRGLRLGPLPPTSQGGGSSPSRALCRVPAAQVLLPGAAGQTPVPGSRLWGRGPFPGLHCLQRRSARTHGAGGPRASASRLTTQRGNSGFRKGIAAITGGPAVFTDFRASGNPAPRPAPRGLPSHTPPSLPGPFSSRQTQASTLSGTCGQLPPQHHDALRAWNVPACCKLPPNTALPTGASRSAEAGGAPCGWRRWSAGHVRPQPWLP